MSDVIETFELGFQWPTIDPFLFCVHHLDRYPAGNEHFGPAASLAGRDLGSDFEGLDGWRMYHGATVPGFPQHPHRGFETITYVRSGLIDHSDSLGAQARFGRGDTQWLTAGRGIVHAEMFPLLDRGEPNTVELFQIWLNLPAAAKLVAPHFTMLWGEQLPHHAAPGVDVTVIAGTWDGVVTPPPPPPDSWAARSEAQVAIWHLRLDAGATVRLPAAASTAGPATRRVVHGFAGGDWSIAGIDLAPRSGALVDATRDLTIAAGKDALECLVLQGRPIGEPVAQYGPFVMNTRAEIEQAFVDYRATGFGGWPWPADDPVHGPDPARFARYADGRVERP